MTDTPSRSLSASTRAAQALHFVDPATGGVSHPIALSSTFARDAEYAPRQGYIYARDGGPTVEQAEALIADLDGAERTLLFASGMAAIVALLETLPAGAHVVAPRVMYHGTLAWLDRLQSRGRIVLDLFDAGEDDALASAIRPGLTSLVWIETPTNPTWDVIDIAAAAERAHAAGARLAVDCTAAPPCTTPALALGADIVFQSGTKYLNGHSDLTAGVLSLRDRRELASDLVTVRTLMGSVIGGFEAWLLIRGLRTLFLRYERASRNALAIATHLARHPGVARVLYPGLPGHPRHEVAARQMTGGFGGMLSFLVDGDFARAGRLVRATRVFLPATSMGGVESLIEHRKAIEGPASAVPDTLLRLSIGIEDADDLIADLDEALASVA